MIGYFGRLAPAKVTLWCYLVWYVVIVAFYFDPSIVLWLSSLGISALIGFALLLSTATASHKPDQWVVFRLFLIPFCVSSYAALIKGKGFVLLFPTNLFQLATGAAVCALFVSFHKICRLSLKKHSALK